MLMTLVVLVLMMIFYGIGELKKHTRRKALKERMANILLNDEDNHRQRLKRIVMANHEDETIFLEEVEYKQYVGIAQLIHILVKTEALKTLIIQHYIRLIKPHRTRGEIGIGSI